MSYSEENGQVILTMSREDYERLLFVFGGAAGFAMGSDGYFGVLRKDVLIELLNRLNSGNPNYTPYQVEAKKS